MTQAGGNAAFDRAGVTRKRASFDAVTDRTLYLEGDALAAPQGVLNAAAELVAAERAAGGPVSAEVRRLERAIGRLTAVMQGGDGKSEAGKSGGGA